MYIVKNLTTGAETQCDAIETIRWNGADYVPAERDVADGFMALEIVDGGQRYDGTAYAFPGHTLRGTEPEGEFTAVDPPDTGPEPEYTELQKLAQALTDEQLARIALEKEVEQLNGAVCRY